MRQFGVLALVVAGCVWALAQPAFADADALKKIVEGKCVPAMQTAGSPGPCKYVDLDKHYAVLKDLQGASQYLLIPTSTVEGIEDATLEQPNANDYFEDAWEARRYMDESLLRSVPRDDVGLAINSVKGRTQNQFHIHIDCARADVLATLASDENSTTEAWAPLPAPLLGHPYLARKLEQADLSAVNPFALLATGVPAAGADMGDQTLVAIAATFADGHDGFYLLDDHVDLAHADLASGEELLDHDCGVLKPAN